MGGARPKASVKDKNGQLCIAKFPQPDDLYDNVLWEAVALSLAQEVGFNVPSWRVELFIKKPVLIVKRFDRDNKKRIPFLSAMSMIGATDNEEHSYLEILDAIRMHGAYPEKDAVELWKRIVFSILISNTDDHLRNHGFVYERYKGWKLSPLYDVNPTPVEINSQSLSLAIDLNDHTSSILLALSAAEYYGLKREQAEKIVREIACVVKNWKFYAKQFGIAGSQINRMEPSFENHNLERALKL